MTTRRSPVPAIGYTLVELVAALLVTGVLGSLALSAYETHAIRSQIAEAINLVTPIKHAVVEAFIRGEAPVNRTSTDVAEALRKNHNPYVGDLDIKNGRIDIRFGASAHRGLHARTLSLTPYESAGLDVVWICGNEIPGAGLKPLGFAAGGGQAVQIPTTVPGRYLPRTCR
jgi:type IV pilus assembly protein PilA